jgi:hypothetical protein
MITFKQTDMPNQTMVFLCDEFIGNIDRCNQTEYTFYFKVPIYITSNCFGPTSNCIKKKFEKVNILSSKQNLEMLITNVQNSTTNGLHELEQDNWQAASAFFNSAKVNAQMLANITSLKSNDTELFSKCMIVEKIISEQE